MATHQIKLSDPWFAFMRDGVKTYEGRCRWKQAARIRPGDTLLVTRADAIARPEFATQASFTARVVAVHAFRSFEDALVALGLEQTLPGVLNVRAGIKVYKQFVSLATQRMHGVVMIEVDVK